MRKLALGTSFAVGLCCGTPAHALDVVPSSDAAVLAGALLGSGQAITLVGTGDKSFDLTALAAGWANGAIANHGVLLEEDLAGPTGLHAHASSEVSTAAWRPRLTVCYTF